MAYHGGVLFSVQQEVYTGKDSNESGFSLGNVVPRTLKLHPKEEVGRLLQEALNNPDIKYNSRYYAIVKYPKVDPTFFDFLLNPNEGPFW